MADDSEVKVQSSFLLPLDLKRWIEAEAKRLGVSTGEVVRVLLQEAREAKELVAA